MNEGTSRLSRCFDGEGRTSTVSASTAPNPVTAVSYNIFASPNQLTVTFGSTDSDVFSYDPSTFRMNKYQFNIGAQAVTGNLGWNANGSLGSLNITDPFTPANTQNCSYSADDLSRISQTNCGTIWGQTFSYDAFGNIQKNGTPGTGGSTFAPCYQAGPTSNKIALVGGTGSSCTGGVAPQYDANGNYTNDTVRLYAWDADNNMVSINGTAIELSYDAFDRMVDQTAGSTNSEIVYSPDGAKLALMNGTALMKAFVPLPGGATAVYTGGTGPTYFRHTDHLGSSRFASTLTQTLYSDTAYAPFGEPYASSGAIDNSFTGQNQDTTAGLYDFLFREYDPNQSRWISPDPSGLSAVNPTNPQSWNRYSYALNNPLRLVDPLGLVCVDGNGERILNDDGDEEWTDAVSCEDYGGGAWVDPLPPDSVTVSANGPDDNGLLDNPGGFAGIDPSAFSSQMGSFFLNSFISGVENAACSVVPEARTAAVSGSFGELIGLTGSVGQLVNYDTGAVSTFVSGGYFVGANGLVSVSGNVGFVSNLQGSNSNYGGPFNTVYGGVGKFGGYRSVGEGSSPVKEVGGTVGASLIPIPASGGGSYTEYGVVPFGNVYTNALTTPSGPSDLLIFAARQACKKKG